MNRNEATADCECGYASGSAPRLSSQAVSQKSAWNHKQSLRTASSLRSIPQIASSREHAVAAPRSRTTASTCPLRTLSLRSAARSLSAVSSAQHSLVAATPAGVSLSLSLSLSWPVALTGTGGSKTRSQRQPACPARERERAGERGRGRERERERESCRRSARPAPARPRPAPATAAPASGPACAPLSQ